MFASCQPSGAFCFIFLLHVIIMYKKLTPFYFIEMENFKKSLPSIIIAGISIIAPIVLLSGVSFCEEENPDKVLGVVMFFSVMGLWMYY